MTEDEELQLLQGLVELKRVQTLLQERVTVMEKRLKMFDGNPMCPLCRETFTTTESFIHHYKGRHP